MQAFFLAEMLVFFFFLQAPLFDYLMNYLVMCLSDLWFILNNNLIKQVLVEPYFIKKLRHRDAM